LGLQLRVFSVSGLGLRVWGFKVMDFGLRV